MANVLVEGHRGFCAEYPENTLISFAAALDLGVDGIEFDIWLTKDKVPVLMHDGNANRTCGVNRHVRDMTLEEVKALDASYPTKFGDRYAGMNVKVPTFRELLELVRDKRPDLPFLGVEIKEYTEETVDAAVALLKEFGFFERAYFYAFNARTIKYLKTEYNGRTMGYPDFQMKEFVQGSSYDYYEEIGLNMNIVKSEILPFYQAKGFPIHMYCADNDADVEFCLSHGANFITANDPRPLMKKLGRLE